MTWPGPITAITLLTDDVATTKAFYAEVFGLPVVYEDEASAVFRFGSQLINLLRTSEAPEVIAPAEVGNGPRMLLTLTVEDVDATCEEVQRRGVTLLNGPADRPWGVRTATFADPAGHLWEIAG
ncbi:MAG: glyoxalase [Frankiales bacterium]|nr:glyoxalase [Frankiales bacterium]